MKRLFRNLTFFALAAVALTACDKDVEAPYGIPGTDANPLGTHIKGGTGSGTVADPYNVISILNVASNLEAGDNTDDYCFIKGKVVSVTDQFTAQYGTGTFYISVDGTKTNQFYVYRAYYLGNKKWTANDQPLEVGDEVTICAIVTNYNGTIETAQNLGFIYELNGENRGGAPKPLAPAIGDGSLENPFNVSGALKFTKKLGKDVNSTEDVYIKGIVSKIDVSNNKEQNYDSGFGNATFFISDDGEDANTFEVYRANYFNNAKWSEGAGPVLKVGDEVVVYGKVVNYRGNTPETVSGKAYLYSLNGETTPGK